MTSNFKSKRFPGSFPDQGRFAVLIAQFVQRCTTSYFRNRTPRGALWQANRLRYIIKRPAPFAALSPDRYVSKRQEKKGSKKTTACRKADAKNDRRKA